MASIYPNIVRASGKVALLLAAAITLHAECSKVVYLTVDTGSMTPAREIVSILDKHRVKATFFIADEATAEGDTALSPAWAGFWKSLAAGGNAFGTHTMRHWYFRGDLPGGKVSYIGKTGKQESLDAAGVCRELRGVDTAFEKITGRKLDPIWRAPGGHTTPNVLAAARQCGYRHVGWDAAGFLGDELPSGRYPNSLLLRRALANIKDGDVLLMHLGIRSRKDPFWPMLDPLITGLQQRGFCFGTIPEREKR